MLQDYTFPLEEVEDGKVSHEHKQLLEAGCSIKQSNWDGPWWETEIWGVLKEMNQIDIGRQILQLKASAYAKALRGYLGIARRLSVARTYRLGRKRYA